MCKDKTTATYTINDRSFCYKHEAVKFLYNELHWSVEKIANYYGDSINNIQNHINYKGSYLTAGKSVSEIIVELYNDHPKWTYARIAKKAKCDKSYVGQVLRANGIHRRTLKNKTETKKKVFTSSEWEQVMFSRMVLQTNVSEVRVTTELLSSIDVKVNPDTGVMTINKL